MKYLKKIIVSLFISTYSLFGFNIEPFPQNAPMLEIFSTNCLQMTQSQQILKAYIMVGLGNSFGNPKESLDRAIPIYDKRMDKVRDYFQKKLSENPKDKAFIKAKKSFDTAHKLWKSSKKMLLTKPNSKNALLIRANFLLMIDELLKGTKPLATPDLELISLTGKLCRKPLEVTIDYLLKIWDATPKDYEKRLSLIIDNYYVNLQTLSNNKLNNDESKKLLMEAEKGFHFFKFMYNSKRSYIPSLLSKKADDNFLIIRNIKKIYKEQATLHQK